MTKKVLWWIGLVIAILSTILSYSSCSVLAITAGKAKSQITTTTTTTTTTSVDSTNLFPKYHGIQ